MTPEEVLDWRDIATQAARHIDALMLYATVYPTDSHVTDANAFLIRLQQELGQKRFYTEVNQFPATTMDFRSDFAFARKDKP